jgi:hypothetical protein
MASLTGCIECNLWPLDKSAFVIELSIEDFEALRMKSGPAPT